eukprot:182795_1
MSIKRNTRSTSCKVISGYSQQFCIPEDIIKIITKYFHSFFVAIRYDIDDKSNEHIMTIDKESESAYYRRQWRRSNRISTNTHTLYTRLWVRFFVIKAIYPYHTKRKKTTLPGIFNISMQDIDKVNTNDNRFVEIPDDYYSKIKIKNVMKRIAESVNFNYMPEIVVETYDKTKKRWPIQAEKNNSQCVEWRDQIQIGDIIDVREEIGFNVWYQCFVRYIEMKQLCKNSIKIIMEGITSIEPNKLQEYKTNLFNDSVCVGNTETIYVHYIGAKEIYLPFNKRCRKFSVHDLEYIAKRNSHTNGPYRHQRDCFGSMVPNIFGHSSESSESEY